MVVYTLIVLVALLSLWKGGEALRREQIEDLKIDSQEQLDQLANVLESAIAKYQHMPTLLASNDRVRKALRDGLESDIQQLNRELEQINRITEASDSYIIDRDGLTIASSNYRQKMSFVGQNFAFRPYFQQAIKGRPGRYYALGTMSNRRGYYFSYPVYEGDSINGVAVVKVDLMQFEKRFTNQGYEFLLLDPDGIVFGSSRPEWLYQVQGVLTNEEMQRILDSKRYRDRSIGKLSVVYQAAFDQESDIVEFLEVQEDEKGELFQRDAYLQMTRPIQLLGFKISMLSPLATIDEEIALWRAIFAGGATITGLLFAMAILRGRMLRERFDANEMARHNQAYIREVIQNTQAGLVTLDQNKKIESFNPAVEKLLGCSLAPLVGQPLESLFRLTGDKEQSAYGHNPVQSLSNTGAVTLEGELVYGEETQVPVEMTLSELELPDLRHYLVTFHDVTERKLYEHEITQARNELEARVLARTSELEKTNALLRQEIDKHMGTQRELIQTAKLAVLGQLSAGLNHELNQPLTAIRSFADNALKFLERKNYGQTKANLEHISQLGHHMGDIIARFKVFARKGDVQQGAISVQQAISGALRIISPRYKQVGIELILEKSDSFFVKGDMVFLEQVLVNLLANAADAIEEAGQTAKQVRVKQYLEGSQVIIVVQDSGQGLSQEALEHLFEPFYTSKLSGAGLGLGLSISQRIIDAMEGHIYARNLETGGAEFCVSLPYFKSPSERLSGIQLGE
ncbi:hypothetical protein GCM10027340_10580 [Marinomonas epiphytica]